MSHGPPDFQRLLDVLLREREPDILPFYEHFADPEIIEAISRKPITRISALGEQGMRTYFQVLVDFYVGLGFDYVPFEVPLKFPRSNVLETKDTAYLSRGLRTWRDETRGTIETLEDFEEYPWPDPDDAADLMNFEILTRQLPEDMKVVGGVGGGVFEHVSWLMGLANACRTLYTDRLLIERMFETVGSIILAIDKKIVERGYVGALRMGDDLGYRNGTFIPPESLRRYVFPWYRRIVALAHNNGLPFILHSCGNLYVQDKTQRTVMDDLIEDVRIDAKHSYEDAILPVIQAKEKYGDRISILGGVDVDKLVQLPEAGLRSYVRKIIEKCAPGGGYALGSGNSVANYIPVRNYLAMLDEGVRYGKHLQNCQNSGKVLVDSPGKDFIIK